ncbi:hypothetical protein DFH08DRAFT_384100 [Mycena albidolilacea]|uniref:EF-hand domain-containing protein n=1 Tax=Mycena albidolilacea TaxID=1033008 RepID=A0AAD6ZGC5_9AGAR|nr:hypothetical protein DFH08DRAFT_384100 [Mycena albidolilacea]
MDARIERGARALRDAGARLSKIPGSGKGQNKLLMSKLLAVFQSILGTMSFDNDENSQRAKSVADSFMGVIQLEIDRRSNDEEIVAICYSMTSMVFALRALPNGDLSEPELDSHLRDMSSAISDFGEFVDIYYSRLGSWIVRYKRSPELKEMLSNFCEKFWTIEGELGSNLIAAQFETGQTSAIQTSISTLINRIGGASSAAQKRALEKIVHGRNSLESQEEILEVAKELNESVTSSIVDALNADFDILLEENRHRYELKLRGTTMMLDERMSTEKILERMAAGPHDLIEDPDIKKIWEEGRWRGAVKCRVFADALSTYYTEEFLLYYPAIGEAIDEDASGFISVHELDRFLRKKPSTVTTPVWFAFWAGGPPIINAEYTLLIKEIVSSIEQTLEDIEHPDRESEVRIKGYRETLDLVKCIVDWNAWDVDEGDEDISEALIDFAQQMSTGKEKLFRTSLEALEYCVDDGALRYITGDAGIRIEQNILILLYVMLSKHEEIITAGVGDQTGLQLASKYAEMDRTLSTPIWEFYWRYKSLERSWRSQRLDIELQVRSYAGGLFNGWHQEYTKTSSIIVKLLENFEEDETDEDADTIEKKVDKISERMTVLDGRLDRIESLLKQIAGKGIEVTEDNQQKPTRGSGPSEIFQQRAPEDNLSYNSGGRSGDDGGYGSRERVPDEGSGGRSWGDGNGEGFPDEGSGGESRGDENTEGSPDEGNGGQSRGDENRDLDDNLNED